MNSAKLMKKFLLPCGLCAAAVPVIKPLSPPQKAPEPCCHDSDKRKLIRPSELPLYVADNTCSKKAPGPDEDCPPSYLEQGFGTIRRSLKDLYTQVSVYTGTITSTIDTGLAHSQITLDYLREESNTLPRLGAVGIGGLTGLIFGLRGGKFKRLLYFNTGALTMAAICYPRQAKESLAVLKHYTNIGYNFVYGVKPEDANQLEIKWPDLTKLKTPSSFSEMLDMAVGVGSDAVSTISSLVYKETETATQQKQDKPGDTTKKQE